MPAFARHRAVAEQEVVIGILTDWALAWRGSQTLPVGGGRGEYRRTPGQRLVLRVDSGDHQFSSKEEKRINILHHQGFPQ